MTKKDLFHLLILAGGESRRMGMPKGLIDVEGQTLIEDHLNNFAEISSGSVTVVLGYSSNEYLAKIPILSASLNKACYYRGIHVTTVINESYANGQYSSLLKGLALNRAIDSIFVMPVDMFMPGFDLFSDQSVSLRSGFDLVIPEYLGKGGHPILLSQKIVEEIVNDRESKRLDHFISTIELARVKRVKTFDIRVTINFNTEDELKAARAKLTSFS